MKYSGRLPKAVAGELLHEINTKLAAIILQATQLSDNSTSSDVSIRSAKIEMIAFEIAQYLKNAAEKSEWDSNPFEDSQNKAS